MGHLNREGMFLSMSEPCIRAMGRFMNVGFLD